VKLRYIFPLAIAFTLRPIAAQTPSPSEMTLVELRDFCSSEAPASRAACKFYIYGVTQGAKFASAVSKDVSHFCIPDEVGNDFVVALVKEQMRHDLAAYPDDAKMPAVSFVSAVLVRQYPCKNQQPF
jgi:hypothetical protein